VESTIAPRQPSPGTIGRPVSTQTSQPVFSQQEEHLTSTTDTGLKRANQAPVSRETSTRSKLVNEPVAPAPIAGVPPSQIEEVTEIPATSGRDVSTSQQPTRMLIDKQAIPPETHEHRLVKSPDEQSGEKRIVPPAHQVNTPPGSVRIEYVPLASEAYIASPPDAINRIPTQEVIESREVQGIAPEQQGTSPREAFRKPMQRLPETGGRDKASPYTGAQGLLVPGTSDQQGQQGVAHQEATSLTHSYGEVDARGLKRTRLSESLPPPQTSLSVPAAGKQTITVVEQHHERTAEQHPKGVSEPAATMPTIRVTIGRIDVRAVTPSEPANRPKPTRAAPRISLEDYARQNKRGGG